MYIVHEGLFAKKMYANHPRLSPATVFMNISAAFTSKRLSSSVVLNQLNVQFDFNSTIRI